MEHTIVIEPDGTVRFVYADDLAQVFEGEDLHIERASHVEPATGWRGGWAADMKPSGGPVLFADGVGYCLSDPHRIPFATRQAALDAEREWLRANRGL